MLIVFRQDATKEQRAEVVRVLSADGGPGMPRSVSSHGQDLLAWSDMSRPGVMDRRVASLPGVGRVVTVPTPYQLASRVFQPERTVVSVGAARFGVGESVVIAGPCSVESEAQVFAAAEAARAAGAHVLRGGAFKPRTSPYTFQGLGLEGLELLARAGRAVGLPTVTEVMEPDLVEVVAGYVDLLQVGSRNMQNFPLLRAVGQAHRPVVLKRGFAATIEEWLLAAEYVLLEGNSQVILCERGVRSFDPQTRNLLDLACVPLLASLTHLPVIVDPSHATGRRDLVPPMALAAIAAGADGIMVEMQPEPENAISDREQTISPETLRSLVDAIARLRVALGSAPAPVEP